MCHLISLNIFAPNHINPLIVTGLIAISKSKSLNSTLSKILKLHRAQMDKKVVVILRNNHKSIMINFKCKIVDNSIQFMFYNFIEITD